ncbi:MBL fold metallo-hydrolase [Novosphingobium sp.]|uniref:MBL fold metallo-hydrolase n=1 Tax=Novosphingobium sp. TaxID=1874826 RepID=UPI0022C80957|nr:MBL fold metallo-hydrolase [Novosphingobium sp.]MCZ8017465.1 MBL fold metallo-hydrolase [Novosphingobium sp.]MCZ8034012.1 MBL fold metallo-hydrolase [Novosphingobium sp.]MCZ8051367.1 MBL fold metallo-hydrolase [Novosphingobium sp.]MCZ8059713.1 MBL fold metallo-hydrolase [Novosphingobium sp.]MCZ8231551.1 MBL fold metallo-hydrolase [Novosphingobium sp.]
MSMKRKLGLGIAVVVLAVGLALFLGRDRLAQRAFDTAIDQNVGIDRSAALPDGVHVYVCGSGSPMPDADRAGPCLAVLAGQQGFVFDAGAGSIRKLGRMGFPMDKLQGAYLTHLHSDHIDGLGELLLQAWIAGSRGTPLPVSGPEGTDQVIAGLMQVYERDKGYRIAHHGPAVARPGGFGGAASIITLAEGQASQVVYDQGGVKITAIRVIHDPVKPAFGFRLDYKGRSVAISGDTIYAPDFVAASKGADVMFHEALNPKMIGAMGAKLAERGRGDQAKIMADIPGYHASPEDAARAAKEAGVKSLVLYHVVPAPPVKLIERLFLGDAGKIWTGDLRVAHDGMIVSLPSGSQAVDYSDAF